MKVQMQSNFKPPQIIDKYIYSKLTKGSVIILICNL